MKRCVPSFSLRGMPLVLLISLVCVVGVMGMPQDSSTETDDDYNDPGAPLDDDTNTSGDGEDGARHKRHYPVKFCRGVPPYSPFWTPGLDHWCKVNCAKGNCNYKRCVC
ncbi:hypothetical protein OTU49_015984 [Cherax quadricarinatus]|uniref:Uncharacterized protein n=2 Tax=Cherax quadricarinatus TaxID=27406 RepID=A0AAW0Y9S5_CHEQU|nr:uncharacterized protein LOC128687591 [Cherax quadricarinatus]XP_053631107.1 uncharacterized protein LOC128687591 [Cherax quadricarinatus]